MQIEKNIPLASFSSFGVGGEADYFCRVKSKNGLFQAVSLAQDKKIPIFFLGGGSNILFSDRGFKGLVVKLENSEIEEKRPGIFTVGAGVKNAEFFAFTKKRNYDFSSFLTIPGTIGGAIAGNAGVPGAEVSDFLLSAEIFRIERKGFKTVSSDFFNFGYRHTIFHDYPELRSKILIWSAKFSLPEMSSEKITKSAEKIVSIRRKKQPWGKTGGSFFKNPKEGAAGYFLDKAGMKGERVGDAYFSEKHANFMMNAGSATQKQILELARKGAMKVEDQFDIQLEPEVRVLDDQGNSMNK